MAPHPHQMRKNKIKTNPEPETQQTVIDHLEELRWRIIKTGIVFLIGFILSIVFAGSIFTLLESPLAPYHLNLYYFKPFEKVLAYLRLSMFASLLITLPFGIFQIILFVRPALRDQERTWLWIFIIMPILFITGAFFAYRIIIPFILRFFLSFSIEDGVLPLWGIGAYMEFLVMLMLVLGLLFQTPLLLISIVKTGLVSISTLRSSRPYILIFIALIAALFSPPDVVSQLIVALPIYILFEGSLLILRIWK